LSTPPASKALPIAKPWPNASGPLHPKSRFGSRRTPRRGKVYTGKSLTKLQEIALEIQQLRPDSVFFV
jgi:hypothetical protein